MTRPARRPSPKDLERLVRQVLDLLGGGRSGRRPSGLRLPTDFRSLVATLAVVSIVLTVGWFLARERSRPRLVPGSGASRPADGVLFCSWNVENFYDDRDDPANPDEDENWFGRDPDAFEQKVRALSGAILLANDRLGPDVLAMVEVESARCVEALRDALNAGLPSERRYTGIVQRDNPTGRKFGPAILTRLAIREDRTRGAREFDGRRILEAHLESGGAPLVVLASHWTSRVRNGTEDNRERYADALYGRFLELRRDAPDVDVIFSGDFNDGPSDPSVRDHLHAVADPGLIHDDDETPNLLDLVAGRDPDEGTYYYKSRWEFLDHILVSPGLLDAHGWTVVPETLGISDFPEVITGRRGAPWKFGGPKSTGPRGVSDHLALTVRLKVTTTGTTTPVVP